MILCDTNILIHAFNGDSITLSNLKNIGIENIILSSITIMELYKGMGNKQELNILKRKLKFYDIAHINSNISMLALDLTEEYNLSHGLDIADALIAATAVELNLYLFTYNIKDFKFIPNLKLYNFKI